jgi:hypothetical protein
MGWLWVFMAFVAYGVCSGVVWLHFGYFPRWYAVAVVTVVLVVGTPAFVLSQSQM